jgi:glycerol-3-phosphate dehydrogenase
MLQQPDGRIVFVIPYARITASSAPPTSPWTNRKASAHADEESYLLAAANAVLAKPLSPDDIVHRYAASAPSSSNRQGRRETTRDWRLHSHAGQAATTVIGGKITTYRRLAEAVLALTHPSLQALDEIRPAAGRRHPPRTQRNRPSRLRPLPRGPHRPPHGLRPRDRQPPCPPLRRRHRALLTRRPCQRIGPLFEAELDHQRAHEFARHSNDALWRRTKAGLTATPAERAAVAAWFGELVEA